MDTSEIKIIMQHSIEINSMHEDQANYNGYNIGSLYVTFDELCMTNLILIMTR